MLHMGYSKISRAVITYASGSRVLCTCIDVYDPECKWFTTPAPASHVMTGITHWTSIIALTAPFNLFVFRLSSRSDSTLQCFRLVYASSIRSSWITYILTKRCYAIAQLLTVFPVGRASSETLAQELQCDRGTVHDMYPSFGRWLQLFRPSHYGSRLP